MFLFKVKWHFTCLLIIILQCSQTVIGLNTSKSNTVIYSVANTVIHTDDEPRILSVITALKNRLVDIIEPDFGLLDELLRLEVLSQREYSKVGSERMVYEWNDALLDLLTSEDQCGKFLTALQRTGQHHVINFITQNGGQQHNDVELRPIG